MADAEFKPVEKLDRRYKTLNIGLSRRDSEFVEGLAQFLGTSKSEAIRTSIRSMVAQLGVFKE